MSSDRSSWPACFVLAALVLCTVHTPAADWPMWRHDAGRTAATTQRLPSELHLQWVRQCPPLEPAWPDEPRMQFDACYQPVIAGHTVFLNSPRNDTVFALDTADGSLKWTFHTDGPVRFAPIASDGKVYLGSDDGYLYCLRVADGTMLWKFLAAPDERKVLGNKRLISAWPVRGAPVIGDGKLYFAAGIWPFMGIFIYCLDAASGEVVWQNDGTGSMYMSQPHGGALAFAGVAPQGYMTIQGDRLLVAGGRSVPACFDRNTGEFLYYRLYENTKCGHFRVAALGDYFFNSSNVYTLDDGSLLAGVGGRANYNPYAFNINTTPVPTARPDLRCSVVTEDTIYGVFDGKVTACDLAHPHIDITKDSKGRTRNKSAIPQLWSLDTGATELWVKTPSRLYAGKENTIMAVDLPAGENGKPSKSWEAAIEGTPGAIIAGDDRLIVVTLQGGIYCFGPEARKAPTQYPVKEAAARAYDEWERAARRLIWETRADEGYCLVLGAGSGRLAEAIARQSDLHVIVVDPDPDKVAALRESLDAAGLYGERIVAHVGDPLSFRFPPYLASLIVSEDLSAAGFNTGPTFARKVFHALRPYGGAACLQLTSDQTAALKHSVKAAGLQNGEVTQSGPHTLLRRVGALPGSANWTHNHADAGNTCVSRDELVKAPLGLLWFGGSSNATILPRHGHGPSEQVVDGRLFIEGPDTMRAMDVYTGRTLWEVKLPDIGAYYNTTSHQPGASSLGTNYVSAFDGIYIAYGQRCLRLDPATGKQMSEFIIPAASGEDDAPTWGYVTLWEDLLIAAVSPVIFEGEHRPGLQGNWDATSSKQIVAMDRHNGEIRWSLDAALCFRHNAIAIGNDRLFCMDRLPDVEEKRLNRRGKQPAGKPKLLCLDVHTGGVLWQATEDVFGTWLGYSEDHDVLIESGRPSRDMLPGEPGNRIIAYRGSDGELLWDKPHKYYGPCLLHGDRIITQAIALRIAGSAYDLLSGEPLMRTNPLTGREAPWEFARTYGCNTVVASKHLITFRSGAAGYFDLNDDGGTGNLGGFKSGCSSNLIIANGVLNSPDYTRTCTCSYQNQTSLAFVHMPDVEMWTFNTFKLGDGRIKRVGINLGAPGDRRGPDGLIWLDHPSLGGPSPEVAVAISPQSPQWFRRHPSRLDGEGLSWVAASGAKGLTSLTITLGTDAADAQAYDVALYFAEPDDIGPGVRVFDVALQGREVLKDFDIVREAGGPDRAIVREFSGISVQKELELTLRPSASTKARAPILCGIALRARD